MNNKKKRKMQYRSKSRLRAKLSFDEGYAERPLYSIKALTNEKDKGISMIELILDNFSITLGEVKEAQHQKFSQTVTEFSEVKKLKDGTESKIKWTRDERGNIVSPFDRKIKRPEEP